MLKIAFLPHQILDKLLDMVYYCNDMAKYDGLRRLERNRLLKEYRQANPELSLKEIGKVFGICESRVWHILHGNSKKAKSK